jgi:ribose transport system ATP-binding protein
MVGRTIGEFYTKRESNPGREVFRLEGVTRYGFFHNINFSVRAGEILGVCGLAGAGRTEFARSIMGIDPLDAGTIYLDGKKLTVKSTSEAINKGLAYLTESRKIDGLALSISVTENILTCIIPRLSRGPFYFGRKNRNRAVDLVYKLKIIAPGMEIPVRNLSGGNQQKTLMAKWIATTPRVIILDEPTRGVDIGAKEIIHSTIAALAEKGNSVILFTSDLPEMMGLCDRAVIMRMGHIIGEIDRKNMSESSLLLAANGKGEFVT